MRWKCPPPDRVRVYMCVYHPPIIDLCCCFFFGRPNALSLQALESRQAAQAASGEVARKQQPGAIGPAGSTKRMRFTDRDEHMYFWFPLLAGLSELTFDPRQEIRQSALEVGGEKKGDLC